MKLLVIGKQRAPFAVAIRELEKQGVEVVYQEADLENVHGVEASFMCIDEERGSIEGVRYIKAPECYVEPDLFLRGRLKFGGSKNSAPFPSMIVIFNGGK